MKEGGTYILKDFTSTPGNCPSIVSFCFCDAHSILLHPDKLVIIRLLRDTAVGLVAGVMVNTIPSYAEEKGWREYLLPRVRDLGFGFWTSSYIVGAIWGL